MLVKNFSEKAHFAEQSYAAAKRSLIACEHEAGLNEKII